MNVEERIAELEEHLRAARAARAAANLERDAFQAYATKLECQLAAERERAEKAEAACAALRQALDAVHICEDCGGSGIASYTSTDGRPIACETCGGHEDSAGCGIIVPQLPDNPGAELLEAGRAMYRALRSMDRDCCFSRQMDGADEHDDDCPVGRALAAGEQWFGKGASNA